MVSRFAGVASGATAGCLPGTGRREGGGRWPVPPAAAASVLRFTARVRCSQPLRGMMAPATPVRMNIQPVTWRFRNGTWAVIAKVSRSKIGLGW